MSSDKKPMDYPRAIPLRPPQTPPEVVNSPDAPVKEPTASAQSRGRAALLMGGIWLLVFVSASYPLWIDYIWRSSEVATSTSADLNLETEQQNLVASIDSKQASMKPPAGAMTTANAAGPRSDSPVPAPKERYLEALGSLTAVHLYQSFLNIGLLADAVENEQMDVADAQQTLGNITRLMSLVDGQLDKVARTGLDSHDQKELQNIRDLTDVLQKQALALSGYWATGDEENATMYHMARNHAWTGISAILGLENGDTEPPNRVEIDKK